MHFVAKRDSKSKAIIEKLVSMIYAKIGGIIFAFLSSHGTLEVTYEMHFKSEAVFTTFLLVSPQVVVPRLAWLEEMCPRSYESPY